tara:strand:- start:18243 stop:19301 length:1059 start_codon:yes stop_codon:yes gene_type:complete
MNDDLLARYLSYFLIVQILFVQYISRFPETIEKYYSNGVYKVISLFYRSSLGWITFSIGDLIYGVFLFLFIRFIYIIFRDEFTELRSYFLSICGTLSVLYFLFYFSWGLNYYRVPLADRLEISKGSYTTKQLHSFTEKTILKINQLHFSITKNDTLAFQVPYKKKEIYKMTKIGYKNLSQKHSFLKYKAASIKSSLFSTSLSYMGFAGYLNPFTGEAQVNSKIPIYTFAFTASHEVAHQIGYAAENEANFIGYLATTSHTDPYFQLAGHITALKYILNELYKRDADLYKTTLSKLNKGIFKNLKASSIFWNKYENPFEPIFKKGYSTYLKVNKQKDGIKSYSYMVDLLIHYH